MSRISTSGAGGSNQAGGTNSEVQYNSSGSFQGNSGLTYDGVNLSVNNGVINSVGFIFSRNITVNVTVPNGFTMVNSNLNLSAVITLNGDAELILL